MEAYFDNSATTAVYEEAAELMLRIMTEEYGNPSSLHMKGVQAERYIKDATDKISGILRCRPDEIIYTSCGTESNNMALIGSAIAKRRKGRHIITSMYEHPSVLSVCEFLKGEGYEITYIEPTPLSLGGDGGIITPESVSAAVRDDTILVSIMAVNNETGAVNDIKAISRAVKAKNPDCYMHTDATQAIGHIPVIPKDMNVDMLSFSGHKLHAPKGVGFLFLKKGTLIRPILYGGGQQKNMRSGTDNVPGIAGLAKAMEIYFSSFEDNIYRMEEVKDMIIRGLSSFENVIINSGKAPHIISATFPGVRSEVMLHALEDRRIYISGGSACSSNKSSSKGSHVLRAVGMKPEYIESTIRISLSELNDTDEAEYFIKAVGELLPVLRHYTRG